MRPLEPLSIPLGGPHLIEASAGTGKTHAITTLYLRLVLERGLRVEQILVVTFTEAATAELKERVRARLREALEAMSLLKNGGMIQDPLMSELLGRCAPEAARRALQAALNSFDEAGIFTIHAFCMRMLLDSAFESGLPFDGELITSQRQMLDEIVNDFWVNRRHDLFPFEVSHLDKQLQLSTLREIAAQAADNPGIALLPESADARIDQEAVALHQALYVRLREMWREHGAEVRDLLRRAVQAKCLKNYSLYLEGWLTSLAQFFDNPNLRAPVLPHRFEKFTPEFMLPNKNKQAPRHVFFETCARFAQSHYVLLGKLQHVVEEVKYALVQEVWEKLPSQKETLNQLSFQDLLHFLDRALAGEGGNQLVRIISKRFPAALIDEFQDTDASQYRIFKRLFLGTNALFLIGDPKQAIYAFRGADIFTYLAASKDTRHHRYTMNTNWRGDPGLIRATNLLFRGHANPFFFKDIGFPKVGPRPGATDRYVIPSKPGAPLQITILPTDPSGPIKKEWAVKEVPKILGTRISRLLASDALIDGRAVEAGDIAVLVRTNSQAQSVRNALIQNGIPSVLHSNVSIFQTEDAHELERLLRAVAEPSRSRKVKLALSTYLLGCNANEIHQMEINPDLWEQRVKQFRRWRELWVRYGFIQMFRAMIADAEVQRRVFASSEGERSMTNLMHLSELLQEVATRDHLGPAGLIAWLSKQRDVELGEESAYELRLESDARAVSVVTIHRSKGLEYPLVYCPFLWEAAAPPNNTGCLVYHHTELQRRVLDLREEGHDEARQKQAEMARNRKADEEFAERLRLLYVALTRARHYLELMWGPINSCGRSPLGYLLYGRDGEPESDRLKELHKDEQYMQSELARQVKASDGLWQLEELDLKAAGIRYRSPGSVPRLARRPYHRKLRPSRRNSSFSQLTSSSKHRQLLPIQDHDAWDSTPKANLLQDPQKAVQPIALKAFPKGARAGIFYHSILEHLDFVEDGDSQLAQRVEMELRKAGFDVRWLETVAPALRRVLQTQLLPSCDLRLDCIANHERYNEMEFLFPVASQHANNLLTPTNLAEIFSHQQNLPDTYSDQLAQLDFMPLRGYMKGFIDLIFCSQSRWYLVDYKSSFLGETYADYAAEKLPRVMAESHYFLQYHLYTVALHRYLTHSLLNYTYEGSFGGVLYLFIKGMDPELGSGYGVFFDRPPLARIEALNQLMEHAAKEVE